MSDYLVKSKLEDTEWQIKSDARDHRFICDVSDDKYNAGPNPIEYLCGSVNSCIEISAGMINKIHHLGIKNLRIENQAKTEKLDHGKSVVTEMKIKVFFDSDMTRAEKEEFLVHSLHVSTVYQTLKEAIKIYVELG